MTVGTQPARIHNRAGCLFLIAFGVVLSTIAVPSAFGQQAAPDPYPPPTPSETLQALKDSLFDLNQDVALLQHFLEASTVDQHNFQNSKLHSWRIDNPILRDSLFSVLIQVDSSVQAEAGAEAMVLATPEDDLVEVRFGNAVFKGMTLQDAIEKSGDRGLYAKVAASYRYSRNIELRDPLVTIPTPFHPQFMDVGTVPEVFAPGPREAGRMPRNIAAELSLTDLSVQAGEHWGGEIKLGFNEANLPFWSSGTFQLLGTYDRFKFGVVLPMYGGLYGSQLIAPLTIRPRLLNGAPGVAASADVGLVGATLAFLHMTPDDFTSLTNPGGFSYLSGFAIGYSSFGVALSQSSFARAKVGFGMRRISQASVGRQGPDSTEYLRALNDETAFSPYISFEYVKKNETEWITAGVQFFDLTISFFGSLEIIPNVLSIEGRYLWPVAPALRKWENPDFLLITPRLRLTF